MFKDRLTTTIIVIPSVITILFLLPLIQFKIINLLICIISVWEWIKLSTMSLSKQIQWLILIFILLFIILLFSNNQLFFNMKHNQYIACIILTWWLIASLLITCYPYSSILWNKSNLLLMIFGILIIFPFFWGLLILRNYHYNENHYTGSYLLLYIISTVWSMDSFSYIIGKTFGHHRATPRISPYKTWEGYLGGSLITIILFGILFKYIPMCILIDIESSKLFFYSIIIIISSIVGDLTESMFKRTAKIKNSSHLIPGHGGMLDCIDSLYSTIPIITCLIIFTSNP